MNYKPILRRNNLKKIDIDIQCQACDGTGVYVGMAERHGAAVVCYQCKGTGKYNYVLEYENFKKMNIRKNIKRVYKSSYGFCIAPTKIPTASGGVIDLETEGISYEEFKIGKLPEHTRQLACPMLADQGACHNIKGFINRCNKLHGESLLGISLTACKNQPHKSDCWKRFEAGKE